MQTKNLKIRPITAIVFLIMVAVFSQPSFIEGASVVRTDKEIYSQGEMIGVHFANAPGYDSDWICVVPAGSPDTDPGDYKYMPRGLGQGFLLFDPRSPGEYEVRAYYNYRRNGYVVSGRYAFSVGGDIIEANLPPPIPFAAPPELIVLPETYVYVVPDVDVDIFFYNGWWWRPWAGHWYRSRYYNRGWGYYSNVPSFYFDIDPGWRGYYRDRNWYGHRWDYERIPSQRLQRDWKSWRNDRRWERQGTWGVRNFQPRPQQQRQELRQQRQREYQQRQPQVRQPQRLPEVQRQQRQPQVQQPQRLPEVQRQQRQPQVQQPQRLPEVQRQQRQPQVQQPQDCLRFSGNRDSPSPAAARLPEVQRQQRQPQVQQPQRLPEVQRQQRESQVQQPQMQPQERPERRR